MANDVAVVKATMTNLLKTLAIDKIFDKAVFAEKREPKEIIPFFKKVAGQTKEDIHLKTQGMEGLTGYTESSNVNRVAKGASIKGYYESKIMTTGTIISLPAVIEAESRGIGAYAKSAVTDMTKGLIKSALADFDWYAFGNGTGQLALVNGAVTASTTVAVDTPGCYGQLRPGQVIDIQKSDGTLEVDGVRIADVSGQTLVMESAVTCSNDSIITIKDTYNAVPDGLQSIVGTTTFMGINPSTTGNGSWKSFVSDANSAALSVDLVEAFISDHYVYNNQRLPNIMLMDPQSAMNFLKLASADKVVTNAEKYVVGRDFQKKAFYHMYGTIPIYLSTYFGKPSTHTMYLLDTSDLERREVKGLSYFGSDTLHELDARLDWEVKMYWMGQFICTHRKSHAKLYNYDFTA